VRLCVGSFLAVLVLQVFTIGNLSPSVCCTGSIYSAGWDLRTLLRIQKIWWLGAEDQQAFVADRHMNIGFGLNSDIDKTKMDED